MFKAFSTDALMSTNGVTSGGVTLVVAGSLVLVETLGVPLCLDGLSYSASSSPSVVPDPVTLVAPDRISKLAIFMNPLDYCIPSITVFTVLTAAIQSE